MRFNDLIEKKKQGQELTKEEIEFWIEGYVNGQIPDYQVSALLMAIWFKGMQPEELFNLTVSMRNSGDTLDLSGVKGVKVDKHSTGGVGDKTSLALMPMVAACGAKVAKMSGRGLGFSGGTIDKLEAIPGFDVNLSIAEMEKQVNDIGIAIVGQTGKLVPADKMLYALRDVTATVDSLPLIASSIMSKKLAADDDVIVLDVKYGNGAFMHTPTQAEALAKAMIDIGRRYGKKIMAVMSSMEQPLGLAIGNALEVKEAIATLKGEGPADFVELCVKTGGLLLSQAGLATSVSDGEQKIIESINSGAALNKLRQMIKAQKGDPAICDDVSLLPQAAYVTEVKASASGYVAAIPAMEMGLLANELGAGRATKEQDVDPAVGIVMTCKVGDAITCGDVMARVYHNSPLPQGWLLRMNKALQYSDTPVAPIAVIDKTIE